LCGNPAPCREKGQDVAGTIAALFGISRNNHEECVAVTPDVAKCLITKTRLDSETETFVPCIALAENTIGRQPQNGGNGDGFTVGGPMYTLNAFGVHGVAQAIDYEYNAHSINEPTGPLLKGSPTGGGHPLPAVMQFVAPTLTASNDPSRSPQSTEVTNQVAAVHAASMAVRRLTPVECERLQGFPDNYTNIPWRKKEESPDGPRYKALGNSMAVPVMKWIGKRINEVSNGRTKDLLRLSARAISQEHDKSPTRPHLALDLQNLHGEGK
jgi:DNA (cytosine-5)-methyltransferase 1